MSESIGVFAYSAGYLDALGGEEAERPDSEAYMDGYHEGERVAVRERERERFLALAGGIHALHGDT